jgi:ABC-2 type transport system ATP-binding protein
MADAVIKTQGLTKVYSGMTAVDNVNMTVNAGDIYGFIGANGAGKTTFIRMIMGLAKTSGGTIELLKKTDDAGLCDARKKIGCIVESPALIPTMTAVQCLTAHSMLYGNIPNTKIWSLLELVGLKNTGKKTVKNFSLGMKQRLAIAQCLVNDPKVLILDEPTNGLDPQGIVEIRHLIQKLVAENGITVLISSHILAELQQLVTRIGIIKDGKLVDETDVKSVKGSLEDYYLEKVGLK